MVFDVPASNYDAFMGRWSRPLSRSFADYAGVGRGQRALDVGAGTGALTDELVGRLDAANVTAIEPSASFVAALRHRFPGVTVIEAPAEALTVPDASYDVTLAQLVVHFMADPLAGVREMARATRPTGVIAACVWDYGTPRDPLRHYWAAAHEVDARVVDESHRAGTRDGDLSRLFHEAGAQEIESGELTVELTFSSFDDWWLPFQHRVGPAGEHFAQLDPERQARLRDIARAHFGVPPVQMSASAWVARGTPPTP